MIVVGASALLECVRNWLIREAFRSATRVRELHPGRRMRLLLRAPFLNPLEVFDERLDPRLDRFFRRSQT